MCLWHTFDMSPDRTPEPGNYRDFGGDDHDNGVQGCVVFGLVWLFLVGWLIGFGVVIFTGADWMIAVAIWFGGAVVAGVVGYAFGK